MSVRLKMPAIVRSWRSVLQGWYKIINPTEDWRTWRLKWWWMSFIIILELGFIVSMARLTYVSHKKDGFVDVQYTLLNSGSSLTWRNVAHSQLLWTLIPAISFSLFGIGYSTMVAGTSERQPYVELNKVEKNASSVQNTILLDYQAYASFYAWIMAWRNAHIRLSCSIFVQLLSSIFLVSLASNLFRAAVVSQHQPQDMQSLLEFDPTGLGRTGAVVEAIGLASAVRIYGATSPGWMTKSAVVEPFAPVASGAGNISTVTSVYTAKLDCRVVARQDVTVTYKGTNAPSLGDVLISFEDRGCNVGNQGFPVSSLLPSYAVSWSQRCNNSDRGWNDRIGVFIASYSATSQQPLSDMITVACMPSYQKISTNVSAESASGSIISIETSGANIQDMRQYDYRSLHAALTLNAVASVTSRYDFFGQTVYKYAQQSSRNGVVEAAHAVNATQELYSTFFAALGQMQLFTYRTAPKVTPGTLSVARTRLHVVSPIAYILIGLLVMMLACSISLFALACTSVSVLQGDPAGLLSKAVLLMQSDIYTLITENFSNHSHEQVVKSVKKRYSVKTSRCFMDSDRIIRVSGLEEIPRRPKIRASLVHALSARFRRRGNSSTSNSVIRGRGSEEDVPIELSVVEERFPKST